MWTISERSERGGLVLRGEFATKREAVEAMESARKPKTPVYRIWRDYNYLNKDAK